MVNSETSKLKVLLIEDNPRDVRLLQFVLAETGYPFDLEWVERLADGLARLEEGGIDLILLDLQLPDSSWHDTFNKVKEKAHRIPIVVMSGMDNESIAIETVKKGAQDYLVKGNVDINTFIRAMRYAVVRHEMQEELIRLNKKMEKNLHQTEVLIQFSRRINTVLDLDELFNITREFLPRLFHAELFSLFLFDPKRKILRLAVHNHGPRNGLPKSLEVPENEGMMWESIKEQRVIIAEKFSESRYAKPWDKRKYQNDGAVCVPLLAEKMILGALNLNNFSDEGMAKDNLNNIKRVADHLSLAINNATLHKRIEEMTVTDELTQVYNRRFLHQELAKELERSRRYNEEFSLLMIDIDHFKQINDLYGHNVGDGALKEVAKRIRLSLRPTDTACRFGGDEFMIILPQTKGQESLVLAERLRREFMGQPIEHEGERIGVSLSIGVIESRKNEDINGLLSRVDRTLYMAKEKGRNVSVLQ